LTHYILSLLLLLLAAQPPAAPPPPPPDTEIFLASLSASASGLTVGDPVNITSSPGYDNQPSFTPDGRAILFTSIRGGTQTDIYRYDIASRVTSRVTDTPEGEYSATITPDGAHISVIRVEPDQTQRLWRFTIDGRQPEVVLATVKPVGYHAWVDEDTLALFVLGQPATLQLANVRTGASRVIVSGIGRSLQRIPGRGTISFVERKPGADPAAAPTLFVRELDPKTGQSSPLVDAVAGAREADLAWTPDGLLLMADKDVLYGWRRGDREWRKVADLAALGLRGASRMAVSAAGDRIAFVAQPR
jgi:dipeptidyl aminopeptidase/acylaminoacyl peptidase